MNQPCYVTLTGGELPLFTYRPGLAQRAATALVGSLESGALVVLRRTHRDGDVTRELLTQRMARMVQYAIPYNEPDVARSKVERWCE